MAGNGTDFGGKWNWFLREIAGQRPHTQLPPRIHSGTEFLFSAEDRNDYRKYKCMLLVVIFRVKRYVLCYEFSKD